jgi:hypothetical protein
MPMKENRGPFDTSPERINALSDGVFAIIMGHLSSAGPIRKKRTTAFGKVGTILSRVISVGSQLTRF